MKQKAIFIKKKKNIILKIKNLSHNTIYRQNYGQLKDPSTLIYFLYV